MTEDKTKSPVARPRKPRFRRDASWVAIRFIRPSASESHAPGDELPPTYRRHYLQYLWRRNCIGPKGDPWTEAMLAMHRRHEVRKTGVVEEQPAPEPEKDADELEIEQVGGGWYVIKKGGQELTKVRGVEAANAWLEANGYEAAL